MLLVLRGVLCVVWEGFADGLLAQLLLGPMGVLCAVQGGLADGGLTHLLLGPMGVLCAVRGDLACQCWGSSVTCFGGGVFSRFSSLLSFHSFLIFPRPFRFVFFQ